MMHRERKSNQQTVVIPIIKDPDVREPYPPPFEQWEAAAREALESGLGHRYYLPHDYTREEYRRVADIGWLTEYNDDDPRKYGIYGLGIMDYKPGPEDQPDGKIIRILPSEGPPEERVHRADELTNEQFRRLVDLHDPYAEYAKDDCRKYGEIHLARKGFDGRGYLTYEWTDEAVPEVRYEKLHD